MPMCEKCWGRAYWIALMSRKYQADVYAELIENNDCTEEEQAGAYWDPKLGIDTRKLATREEGE